MHTFCLQPAYRRRKCTFATMVNNCHEQVNNCHHKFCGHPGVYLLNFVRHTEFRKYEKPGPK